MDSMVIKFLPDVQERGNECHVHCLCAHKYYQCTSQMRCRVAVIIFTKFWCAGVNGWVRCC